MCCLCQILALFAALQQHWNQHRRARGLSEAEARPSKSLLTIIFLQSTSHLWVYVHDSWKISNEADRAFYSDAVMEGDYGMVFTYKSNGEDTERKGKCWLVSMSFLLPLSPSSISMASWQNIAGSNVGSLVVSGGKPNSGYCKLKRYLLEGYEETHRMKERLKKLTPGPQDPGPSGGLCARPHGETHCCEISFSKLPHSPTPPRLLSSFSFCSRGRVPGESVSVAHSCHPLASRKQSALNLHKGPGRRHAPKGGGGSCFERWRSLAAVCSLYHHDSPWVKVSEYLAQVSGPSPLTHILNLCKVPHLLVTS